VEFCRLFQQLVEWTTPCEPANLERIAREDESIRELCLRLSLQALKLELAERGRRQLLVNPANPSFVRLWRDYEKRYAEPLAAIFLTRIGVPLEAAQPAREALRRFIQNASHDGSARPAAINAAIEFASDMFVNFWADEEADASVTEVENGIRAWKSLREETGIDLAEVYRRRDLVPITLIPRHVSRRYGQEELSLHNLLQQAQEAYVFGVPFACVALMRTVMEMVLKQHYALPHNAVPDRPDLNDIIQAVRNLPRGIGRAELHRMRLLANDVLHASRDRPMPRDLEYAILQSLGVLRVLIEQAPA
jgi:hypothetical protein